ncbi:CXXC motif containing zinc binding protein [Antrostomus carolinensis]|uniref:CXXC motif containing zinc binding protein n=1 Tax=Antrostomus carolinensis TaxID=279965 RepID=UPI0010A98986|nr:CXXC motif containing zinc binding protein [Antrostomus carolinensis]
MLCNTFSIQGAEGQTLCVTQTCQVESAHRPDGIDSASDLPLAPLSCETLKCGNCGEVSEKWQYLRLMDSAPLKGGRGSATMVQKCKLCSRENSIDILSQTIKPYNCRGLEPVDFQPQAGFAAEGAESGTPFNDINLLEKDWNDYDEKTKESVGIYEVTHKFVKC